MHAQTCASDVTWVICLLENNIIDVYRQIDITIVLYVYRYSVKYICTILYAFLIDFKKAGDS